MATPIEAVLGDITTQRVDAIVNAANSSLLGGGGVDGAIHRAAGPELLKACRQIRATDHPAGLPVGQAVATDGFNLPATWVVHTVGPNRNIGETNPDDLAACFVNSLKVARRIGARTVAFPAIGAGVYGWEAADVARIAVTAVTGELDRCASFDLVRFVLFSEHVLSAFTAVLAA